MPGHPISKHLCSLALLLIPLTALLAGCQTQEPVTPANPKPVPQPTDPAAELSVTLNATPREGAAPLVVTFEATATGYTPDYLWDFGDGSDPVYGESTLSHDPQSHLQGSGALQRDGQRRQQRSPQPRQRDPHRPLTSL